MSQAPEPVADEHATIDDLCVRPACQELGADIWDSDEELVGVAEVPVTLGSASARYLDLLANKESEEPSAQLIAHDIRDTMHEIRPYKGR